MGVVRNIRRNNNIKGLRSQISEKEKELYAAEAKLRMFDMHIIELQKIMGVMKTIIITDLKQTEEEIVARIDKELELLEAAEIDKAVNLTDDKPEEVTEIIEENEIPEEGDDQPPIEKTIKEVEEETKKSKPTKKAKKKIIKESSKDKK